MPLDGLTWEREDTQGAKIQIKTPLEIQFAVEDADLARRLVIHIQRIEAEVPRPVSADSYQSLARLAIPSPRLPPHRPRHAQARAHIAPYATATASASAMVACASARLTV
jgi:hypothetical protein